jgi:hypothetical protein
MIILLIRLSELPFCVVYPILGHTRTSILLADSISQLYPHIGMRMYNVHVCMPAYLRGWQAACLSVGMQVGVHAYVS